MRKIRTHHRHKKGRVFSWLVLILGTAVGLILPVLPSFIKTMVKTDSNVSLFYALMAIVMLVAALISSIIFRQVNRSKITRASFLLLSILTFILIFTIKVEQLALIQSLRIWLILYVTMALSLFIRDFSKKEELGEEEGIHYKFHNIGYFIGPLLGGFLATKFSYETVFILASTLYLIGLIYFFHNHIGKKHTAIIDRKHEDYKIIKNIKLFFKDAERRKIYLVTVALMTWVGFKRLYVPLYILLMGYIESLTGIILALSILPLIFLEVKVGEYADKKGIKKPISLGMFIMGISLIFVFLSPYPLINLLIIIIANIGNAFVEPLQEYYLFKHLPEKDEDSLYGIYMTADPVAYFLAPAIGGLCLLVMPFNYLFLIFGTLMLLCGAFSWAKLKN